MVVSFNWLSSFMLPRSFKLITNCKSVLHSGLFLSQLLTLLTIFFSSHCYRFAFVSLSCTFPSFLICLCPQYPFSRSPLSSLGDGLPSWSFSHKALDGVFRRRSGRERWSPGLKDWDTPPSRPLLKPQPCLEEPSLRRAVLRTTLDGSSASPWEDTLLRVEGDPGALVGSCSWPVQTHLL